MCNMNISKSLLFDNIFPYILPKSLRMYVDFSKAKKIKDTWKLPIYYDCIFDEKKHKYTKEHHFHEIDGICYINRPCSVYNGIAVKFKISNRVIYGVNLKHIVEGEINENSFRY